jgi:hypothetical protein
MAEGYIPFSSGSGATVTDAQWGEMGRALLGTGVIKGAAGTDLAITAGAGLSINMGIGEAWVFGHYYENTASKNQVLSTADPSLPRIDRIVIKFDLAAKTVSQAYKVGTPAGSPVAPTLTQTSSTWEMSLAQVRVNAGATTPTSITDERTYASAIVPSSLPSGTTLNGSTIWTISNDGTGSGLDADLLDGKDSTAFVQVGAGNEAATPVVILVTDVLPAAGTKGRIAIKTPFAMP